MNSQKKIHIRTYIRSKNRSTPQLKLIPGGNQKPNNNPRRTLLGALVVFFIVSLGLIYGSMRKQKDPTQSLDLFQALHEVLQREGILRYLDQKNELKKVVRLQLEKNESGPSTAQARNIAVYLFPDVLAPDDFEKDVAIEQWIGIENEIEKSPRTPESRVLFNELRANIWNYESPDRANPQLSLVAKQVLRIYETLSAP